MERDTSSGAGFDRRTFVGGAAGTVGLAVASDAYAQVQRVQNLAGAEVGPGIFQVLGLPLYSIAAVRREDFLFLRLDFFNMQRKPGSGVVTRKFAGRPAFLVVSFVPQHLAERAWKESETPKAPGHEAALLAHGSRLAFRVKGATLPLKLDALLDFGSAKLNPSLVPVARTSAPRPGLEIIATAQPIALPVLAPRKAPRIRNPAATETAIELPWRLMLSPTLDGHWVHDLQPRKLNGWTEVWHAALYDGAQEGASVRAVWTTDARQKQPKRGKSILTSDHQPPDDQRPFLTSLDTRNRWAIVKATSDFTIKGRDDVAARKLWLSSLGGTLDSRGHWDIDETVVNLVEWKHLATGGRDHYVKVVERGYLYPWGHRCLKIKVTERRFERAHKPQTATLRQFEFLFILEPKKSYNAADTFGMPHDGRELPFRSIEFKTLRTPKLDDNAAVAFGGVAGAFPIAVGGGAFRFHASGVDWAGRTADFTVGGVYITGESAFAHSGAYSTAFAALGTDYTQTALHGATVAFAAPLDPAAPGDTDAEVKTITWAGVAVPDAETAGADNAYHQHHQPAFYPRLAEARVRLSAAEQASGSTTTSPRVAYDGADAGYLSGGFGATAGKVFLQTVGEPPAVKFTGGSAGGMVTPDLAVSGLSRSLGPVSGDVTAIRAGTFDHRFFDGVAGAKILGGVPLSSLILPLQNPGDAPGPEFPQLRYRRIPATATAPEQIITHFHWEPVFVADHPVVRPKDPAARGQFVLDGRIETTVGTSGSTIATVLGRLTDFTVDLIDADDEGTHFIKIEFDELSFAATTNGKSDVVAVVTGGAAGVSFHGPLEFISDLAAYLNFGSDPLTITVTDDSISADLSVALPSISVGVLALENLAFLAGFNLPLGSDPARFRFSLSTIDAPFTLSILIFTGTGYFGIAIGTDGVELVEVAFEFGASISLDIGIASGGVHLLAGIYFGYGDEDASGVDRVTLTGYVSMGGELSVLGIVRLSVEFYLGLTYVSDDTAYGEATLTVEVEVLFFSFSVDLSTSQEFDNPSSSRAGRALGARPKLGVQDQWLQGDWDTYCAAFAA